MSAAESLTVFEPELDGINGLYILEHSQMQCRGELYRSQLRCIFIFIHIFLICTHVLTACLSAHQKRVCSHTYGPFKTKAGM